MQDPNGYIFVSRLADIDVLLLNLIYLDVRRRKLYARCVDMAKIFIDEKLLDNTIGTAVRFQQK